jgi:CheY-like chemotaxis protein
MDTSSAGWSRAGDYTDGSPRRVNRIGAIAIRPAGCGKTPAAARCPSATGSRVIITPRRTPGGVAGGGGVSDPSVLVVEDEPDVRRVFCAHLEDAGYRALAAADGVEAYRLFEDERPDAILLDLNVPRISGFRLLRLFRDARPEVPIFVATGLTFEEAEEVARFGIEAFLTKPFDFEEFLRHLDRLLRRS